MVLESVVLGVLAALGWGVSDFTAAVVSKKAGVLRTAVWVHLASVGLASVYLLAAEDLGRLSLAHWVALAGLSALAFIIYLVFYRALQLGPVAIISPILSAYAVVVILLAVVFSGERLNSIQAIGAAASIGGVVLASVNPAGLRAHQSLIGRGVLLGVISMIVMGLWQYFIGVLSRDIGWFLTIYVNRLLTMAALVSMAVYVRRWPWQRLGLPLAAGAAVAGVVEMAGLFAFARGTEVGVISIVAAASTVYPVLPILGGLLLFRERIAATQAGGLVLVLLGLLALSLSM